MKKIFNLKRTALFKICPPKTLRIMKLTNLLLLVTIFNAFGSETYSQYARLSLDMNDVPIQTVLTSIEGQSEFFFLYSSKMIDVAQKVDIHAQSKNIFEVLDELLLRTDIEYTVKDRQIMLVNKASETSDPLQQSRITGTITDEKGSPFPGVNITVEETTIGAISDINGKYSMDVPDKNIVLIFTFVGYTTQRIPVDGKNTIDVVMAPDVMNLDEVVVIGYGTARRATITGSVASVDGDKLQVANSTNFTNTLVGRLPGLVAVQRSGLPGGDDATLRIRGNNTLNNNNPLIVVDGIANRSMSRLDAADIESVIILKDASAAIYGAQAANGVILITTKRGASGKLKVNANFNQGFSSPTILPEMADSYLYATMMNELDTYQGQNPRFTSDDLQKFKDGSDPWGHPNTNWFKEVFKPVSLQNNANINLSGGTESVKYFVSIGSRFQDATYRKSGANYSQVDFRSNIDGKLSDNINISIDIAGRQENRKWPVSPFGGDNIENFTFRLVPRGKPTDVAWWWNGLPGPDVESDCNPVVMVTDIPGYNRHIVYTMESNMRLNINIPWVKGLSVTGNASIDKNFQNNKRWQVPYYLYVWDKLTYDNNGMPLLSGSKRGYSDPQLDQSMADGQQVTLNALINYERRIKENHKVKILVGSESSVGKSMNIYALRKYYVSSALAELFAGSDLEKDNTGSSSESARLNYFGRVNYDYLSKYLVEFVWRYDGSYKFPSDKRWGFFPGFSLGWVISEENFWNSNIGFLNYFKLRGSWGQTGNDRISDFQYLSTYGFGTGVLDFWVWNKDVKSKILREARIPNENITWEVANQTDIGFDAQMLEGKLKLEGDYFYNLRTNILTQRNASVPQSTGLTLPPENIGEVVNQGFEFVIGYGDKAGDFVYNISLNGGYAKNKIKFWDETPGIPEYQQTTGHPMNSSLYYQAIGIFKDQASVDAYPHWVGARPGDIIFKDVNEDGKIDGLDQVRDYRSNIPLYTTGLNIDLTYRNFYATVLLQGAFGKIRYHSVESGEAGNYYMEDAEGRWTEDNSDATKPRTFGYGGEYWRAQVNTYWLRSADYVRLKNIEIGYNFPQAINSRLHIDGFRIYVGGLNLITWCPGLKSFDPESTAQDYPLSKVINVGATLTF